jgi:hypothetical protein
VCGGRSMWQHSKQHQRAVQSDANVAVAKRFANELLPHAERRHAVEKASALVRDIDLGESYSFLTQPFEPRYSYWEIIDFVRKLLLFGLGYVFDNGTLELLSVRPRRESR